MFCGLLLKIKFVHVGRGVHGVSYPMKDMNAIFDNY